MTALESIRLAHRARNEGGFTLQRTLDGRYVDVDQSESGWSVAMPHAEQRETRGRWAHAIRHYVEAHESELGQSGVYLGAWSTGASADESELVLDLVQIIPDRDTAIEIGRLGQQDAIYNLITHETLYL